MTEDDILRLIQSDPWMMKVLHTAEELNLPDWMIGAGFVRNKVWNYLSGIKKDEVDTADIDLVYYDPLGNDEAADEALSKKLKVETGLKWEVVNEHHAHKWTDVPAYTSTEDAIARWPETATAIGVSIRDGKLKLFAPYGIDDLVNLRVRPSPKFPGGIMVVKQRMAKKNWLEKWPKLKVIES